MVNKGFKKHASLFSNKPTAIVYMHGADNYLQHRDPSKHASLFCNDQQHAPWYADRVGMLSYRDCNKVITHSGRCFQVWSGSRSGMGDGASWLTPNAMLRGMLRRVLPLLIFLVVTMPRLPLIFWACSFGARMPLSVAHLNREGIWVSEAIKQEH